MHYSLQYSKYICLNYFDRLFRWSKTQGEIAILADAEKNKSAKKGCSSRQPFLRGVVEICQLFFL